MTIPAGCSPKLLTILPVADSFRTQPVIFHTPTIDDATSCAVVGPGNARRKTSAIAVIVTSLFTIPSLGLIEASVFLRAMRGQTFALAQHCSNEPYQQELNLPVSSVTA